MANKAIGLAMLVAGVILVIYGINASESFASEVEEAVSGTPTDSAMWMLIGGAVLGIVGLFLTLRPARAAV